MGGGRGGEGRVLVMRCFSNSRTSFFGSGVCVCVCVCGGGGGGGVVRDFLEGR